MSAPVTRVRTVPRAMTFLIITRVIVPLDGKEPTVTRVGTTKHTCLVKGKITKILKLIKYVVFLFLLY